jgi:hypothetical protein
VSLLHPSRYLNAAASSSDKCHLDVLMCFTTGFMGQPVHSKHEGRERDG